VLKFVYIFNPFTGTNLLLCLNQTFCKAPKVPLFKGLHLFVVLFLLVLTLTASMAAHLDLPAQYGEVIYQTNEKSPNQLYIIGTGHRDSLTCLNSNLTPRVQAEVYKIGEWLIDQRGIELLLPEGFFKNGTKKVSKEKTQAVRGKKRPPEGVDIKVLEERLSTNKTYVNAEMLLIRDHSLRVQQIEDKGHYDAVGNGIFKLVNSGKDLCDYSLQKSELDYLQERRIAAILQKIPERIDEELRQGNIPDRKALFTIGMSHLPRIIKYLNEKRITIPSPLLTSNKNDDYPAELNLFKENFGVSILIPRTLANDKEILKLNGLDKIVEQSRSKSPVLSSFASPRHP